MEITEMNGAVAERPEHADESSTNETNMTGATATGEPVTAAATSVETESSETETQLAEPSAISQPDVIRELIERVEGLEDVVNEANRLSFERERIIDRLHQENQQLRAGEIQQAITPLVRDLVRLYDDLKQTAQRYEEGAGKEMGEVVRDFQSFRDTVEDILYRQSIERYDAAEGDSFNPKEHKALGVVQTHEQNLDRTIARVVRSGFRTDTRIIRFLEAEVHRYVPAADPAPAEEEQREQPAADV